MKQNINHYQALNGVCPKHKKENARFMGDENGWKLHILCLMSQETFLEKLELSCTLRNSTSFDEDMKQLKLIYMADNNVHMHLLRPRNCISKK